MDMPLLPLPKSLCGQVRTLYFFKLESVNSQKVVITPRMYKDCRGYKTIQKQNKKIPHIQPL